MVFYDTSLATLVNVDVDNIKNITKPTVKTSIEDKHATDFACINLPCQTCFNLAGNVSIGSMREIY
jgi:hypothetical protein